jgi:hypothetical protein
VNRGREIEKIVWHGKNERWRMRCLYRGKTKMFPEG